MPRKYTVEQLKARQEQLRAVMARQVEEAKDLRRRVKREEAKVRRGQKDRFVHLGRFVNETLEVETEEEFVAVMERYGVPLKGRG